MSRLSVAVVSLSAATLALTSCSSSGSGGKTSAAPPQSSAAGGGGFTITIKDFKYSGDLTVKPGAKITVIDQDSAPHTLTGDKFDSGTVSQGKPGTITAPADAGAYKFGCNFHSNMAGTLTVKA